MPYIITTTTAFNDPQLACCGRDAADCDCDAPRKYPASHAVATLDEARERARGAVNQSTFVAAMPTIDTLPESGGTIGPLPDGTMIEVRKVTLADLSNACGGSWAASGPVERTGRVAAILAAYNAR